MSLPPFYTPSLLDQSFGLCINPQDLILPYYNFQGNNNYYRPWKWMKDMDQKDFGSTIENGKDIFKICLDVQHFNPSEISVKVVEQELVIEGKHEEREDNHGFISRQFKRRYVLPKDCKAGSVVSSLSSDGILMVTANKSNAPKGKEIIVPIQICTQNVKKDAVKTNYQTSKIMNNTKIDCADSKSSTASMLKEDHCCLMKPELIGKSVGNSKENSAQLSVERDDISEFIKELTARNRESNIEVNESTSEQKSAEISSARENMSALLSQKEQASTMESAAGFSTSVMEKSQTSMLSETTEMQQISSYTSSLSSSIKETSERISGLVTDISEQLTKAAENF